MYLYEFIFRGFTVYLKNKLKLSQYGKFINVGYETKQYEVIMCDFQLSN